MPATDDHEDDDNYEDENYDDYYNDIADDDECYQCDLGTVNILSPHSEPSVIVTQQKQQINTDLHQFNLVANDNEEEKMEDFEQYEDSADKDDEIPE